MDRRRGRAAHGSDKLICFSLLGVVFGFVVAKSDRERAEMEKVRKLNLGLDNINCGRVSTTYLTDSQHTLHVYQAKW